MNQLRIPVTSGFDFQVSFMIQYFGIAQKWPDHFLPCSITNVPAWIFSFSFCLLPLFGWLDSLAFQRGVTDSEELDRIESPESMYQSWSQMGSLKLPKSLHRGMIA
jgi:hypothetical protein